MQRSSTTGLGFGALVLLSGCGFRTSLSLDPSGERRLDLDLDFNLGLDLGLGLGLDLDQHLVRADDLHRLLDDPGLR